MGTSTCSLLSKHWGAAWGAETIVLDFRNFPESQWASVKNVPLESWSQGQRVILASVGTEVKHTCCRYFCFCKARPREMAAWISKLGVVLGGVRSH